MRIPPDRSTRHLSVVIALVILVVFFGLLISYTKSVSGASLPFAPFTPTTNVEDDDNAQSVYNVRGRCSQGKLITLFVETKRAALIQIDLSDSMCQSEKGFDKSN